MDWVARSITYNMLQLQHSQEILPLIIHPKTRGFICTTTHPVGCEYNVLEQIQSTRARGVRSNGKEGCGNWCFQRLRFGHKN